ncbi:MAG: hypothetical protein HOP15_17155 [Planctomycetes bacterium]|nr:hypothetical protein [Planctomycetota bacterium]
MDVALLASRSWAGGAGPSGAESAWKSASGLDGVAWRQSPRLIGLLRRHGRGHELRLRQPPGDHAPRARLLGTSAAEQRTFGSCCHGAGRVLSRTKARELAKGRDIGRELAKQGISLQAAGRATVEEVISEAYKDVADVIEVVVRAGLARPVAKLKPFAVVKG